MMPSSRTNRLLVFAAAAALGVCIAYGALVYLVHKQISSVAEQQEQLGLATAQVNQARSLRSLVRDTEARRVELASRFLSSSDLVDFLEELEDVGTATGATITIRSVEEAERSITDERKRALKHPGLELSLTATGSWNAVYRTLRMIESLPYPLVMETLSMDPDPDSGWSVSMRLGIATQ